MGRRRAGRKRKSGDRYPSGGLKKKESPDDVLRIRTSRQPHRRTLKDELRLDERASSALGRLHLKGIISAECYDAGARYAYLVGQYLSVIESPKSTAGSGLGGAGCAVEREGTVDKMVELFGDEKTIKPGGSCFDDPDGCECLQRKRRYDGAFEALTGVRSGSPTLADIASEKPHPALAKAIARAVATKGYQALPPQDQKAAKAVARSRRARRRAGR